MLARSCYTTECLDLETSVINDWTGCATGLQEASCPAPVLGAGVMGTPQGPWTLDAAVLPDCGLLYTGRPCSGNLPAAPSAAPT